MSLNYNFSRYKKLAIGCGFTTLVGLIFYEYYKLKKNISAIVDTNVLYLDRKRPDYIYIKYHIYRESMQKRKFKEEEKSKIINVMLHPIGKWWKSMKHSIAWRLLERAQKGDQHDRNKATRQLALIDHLKDWDFQHLAQLCDSRTAVSLARSDCDQRWFLKPKMHKVLKNPKILIKEIRGFLEEIKPNKCVDYFLYKTFSGYDVKEPHSDDLFVSYGINLPNQETDLLKQCVEILLHLSSKNHIRKQLIQKGGLSILMELHKIFHSDSDMKLLLCKTLSNLSLCSEMQEDFFVTGWIGILAKWTNDNDMRVQVTSSKALSNLDTDDPNNFSYPYKVFPLYPINRSRRKPELDIVFIHGLLGGVFITWRQKDRIESKHSIYGKHGRRDDINLKDNDSRGNSVDNNNIDSTSENITINEKMITAIKKRKTRDKIKNMSDTKAKEIIEALEAEIELPSDWEVVFPDCPIKSTENTNGQNKNEKQMYSVSGSKWVNDDYNEEYSNCWPMDWLPNDFPNIRVIGCNYESSLSYWSTNVGCPCEKIGGKLEQRAKEFLEYLAEAGVGQNQRPVVWVGHSMGGLIAKSIIVQAQDSQDPKLNAIGKNTKAILFLGTPHKGSQVLPIKQHTQMLLSPTVEVVELRENAKHLLKLNDKFINYVKNHDKGIEVVSIAEGLPTILTSLKLPFNIVTPESALIETGDFYILNEDHLGISKPIFRQSFLYQRLLRMIEAALQKPIQIKKNDGKLHENVANA